MQPRCTGRTKAGAPCQAPAMSGGRYCVTHDPARVTDLAEWRRRGGQGRSNKRRAQRALPAEPMGAEELQAWLGIVFKRVIAGTTEPGVGTAAATIARAIVTIKEATELEQRIEELERTAGTTAAKGGWGS